MKMSDFLNRICQKISGILLAVMCILVFTSTLARIFGIGGSSLIWSEEASRYMMIWMSYLVIGNGASKNEHFRITGFIDALPSKIRRNLLICTEIISIIFMMLLVYFGMNIIMSLIKTGQTSPMLRLPMFIPYLAIPLGSLIMAVQLLISIVTIIKKNDEGVKSN